MPRDETRVGDEPRTGYVQEKLQNSEVRKCGVVVKNFQDGLRPDHSSNNCFRFCLKIVIASRVKVRKVKINLFRISDFGCDLRHRSQ